MSFLLSVLHYLLFSHHQYHVCPMIAPCAFLWHRNAIPLQMKTLSFIVFFSRLFYQQLLAFVNSKETFTYVNMYVYASMYDVLLIHFHFTLFEFEYVLRGVKKREKFIYLINFLLLFTMWFVIFTSFCHTFFFAFTSFSILFFTCHTGVVLSCIQSALSKQRKWGKSSNGIKRKLSLNFEQQYEMLMFEHVKAYGCRRHYYLNRVIEAARERITINENWTQQQLQSAKTTFLI